MQHFVPYKSQTSCGKRSAAAHQAGKTKKTSKDAREKNDKLNNSLLEVNDRRYRQLLEEKSVDIDRLKYEVIFVDGGDKGNPPISPKEKGDGKKKLTILKINEEALFVARDHHKNCFANRGIRFRLDEGSGRMVFTLCPRPNVLEQFGMVEDPEKGRKIIEAFQVSIDCAKTTLKRGKSTFINRDDGATKYVCVGSGKFVIIISSSPFICTLLIILLFVEILYQRQSVAPRVAVKSILFWIQ